MRHTIRRFLIEFLSAIFLLACGAFLGAAHYNKAVEATDIKLLVYLCHKNDGIKYVYRSWMDATKFVVKCNDTATYIDVSIHIRDQITEWKESK